MAVFQNGIDVSRYQGNVNWSQVAASGKEFAIVRIGSSNSGGLYVDPYFLQNVNGAHAAGCASGLTIIPTPAPRRPSPMNCPCSSTPCRACSWNTRSLWMWRIPA